jgi:hypothetical protein
MQRSQVVDQLAHFRVGQGELRHQVAGLEVLVAGDPARQRGRVDGQDAGTQRQAAGEMRQVGAEFPLGADAADGVAGRAVFEEQAAPFRPASAFRSRACSPIRRCCR